MMLRLPSAAPTTLSLHPRQVQPISTISRGFTIVELLIVIIVIAILATITIVAYNGMQARAVESSMKSTLRQAMSQIETDKVLTGHYASDAASVGQNGLASGGDNVLSYFLVGNGFCVSVANPKSNTPVRFASVEGKIMNGTCEDVGEEEEDPLPTAVAAWAFNEGTGSTASSTVGSHNGILGSGAGWQLAAMAAAYHSTVLVRASPSRMQHRLISPARCQLWPGFAPLA